MKQSRAIDPEECRRWVRDFERRLLDEEAHYLYTLTPSHYLNNQLDTVWLAE